MRSPTTSMNTSTETLTLAIDADAAAFIQKKGVKDVSSYLISLIKAEQDRQARGQDAKSAGEEANELSQRAPNAV